MNNLERIYRFLGSKGLAVSLFAVLSLILVPGTLVEREDISLGVAGSVVLGLMGLNLFFCTVQRMRSISLPVIVLHGGILAVMAGGVISSFGYVATVNVYEGSSVDTAYRWDVKKDMPLGFDLAVKKIHMEYYPIPVKVGVLRGDEKFALFVLKTGESFSLDPYTVKADAMEFPSENLRLSVLLGGRLVGTVDTGGERNLPSDFPYGFKLVAFKNPALKGAWVDLMISKGSRVFTEGTSGVNSPLTWEKLNFYNTASDADRYGMRFAGIQITYDPGRPFVFWGFAVIGLGSGMYFVRKVYGYR